MKLSCLSGPPTIAPVSSLGLSESLLYQFTKLMGQLTSLLASSTGTEAPLWCGFFGGLFPNPAIYDLP
ncbi:hypothetical protein SLEP1_g12802 [Rubroshorea leprosula]|uniref:Uncharacterized protein n=1 Tax=Rubroshorea leprosula TaxID=152421 RepID=A0AAV5IMH3_9ROSI|nr:hypothetical protein SLEP1_g12802 [Rubroshorea leprosula]